MTNFKKPELLAPAGSYPAFVAAISAGADAVYMGGASHNARIGAKNFTDEELERAVREAHFYGKKVYITLNTLLSDRELEGVLDRARALTEIGADAFIVQDLGLIRAMRQTLPDAEIHASTQCITHSSDGVRELARMGVKRAVIAREISRDDLAEVCKGSPIEIEAFVHGALCVCHSGACLFSSLVGGRSGNRGECAQPCRLPYSVKGYGNSYPLSLTDLTLSQHLCELCDMGVTSLKIEGRMKSEDYVGGVVSIFRYLIDSGRDADSGEVERLAEIFSRGGFTDGYYKRTLGAEMFSVRSKEDKEATRAVEKKEYSLPKLPLDASLDINEKGAALKVSAAGRTATARLGAPDIAVNRPIDEAYAKEQISKLGQTVFELRRFDFSCNGSYIIPKSALNALRREALDGLSEGRRVEAVPLETPKAQPRRRYEKYAVLAPHRRDREVKGFDRVYYPLFAVPEVVTDRVGVALPIIIWDSQRAEVTAQLISLRERGVKYAYAESLGSLKTAVDLGFLVIAGTRINAYNSHTLNALAASGAEGVVLSSELTPPMKRDIVKSLPVGETVYGRAPLMIMENCVMGCRDKCRDTNDFKECRKHTELVDRMGISFPVYPEYFHRCQIYNSRITYNADRPTSGMSFGIYFITDEKSPEEALLERIPRDHTRKG